MRSHHLATAWKAMGHETVVFLARYHHLLTVDSLPKKQEIGGTEYCALDARRYDGNGMARVLNLIDYSRSMWSLEREDRPDAIIVSSPHPLAIFPAARLATRYNAKLIFEVRDLWPLSLTEIAGVSRLHPFILLLSAAERYAYRRADLVASLLRTAEPHMLARGLRPGKFLWVPNGISDEASPEAPTSPEGKAAATQIEEWHARGRKVIIHPGAQGVPNALDRLIKAVSLVPQQDRFGVLLVGRGTESETLREMARDMPTVRLFGQVPKSEALWLTQASDFGYAGGAPLPIYRYGTSFNKVADFVRFSLPTIETIDTGAGVAAADGSPQAIADAIATMLATAPETFAPQLERLREALDYDAIAARYVEAIRELPTPSSTY